MNQPLNQHSVALQFWDDCIRWGVSMPWSRLTPPAASSARLGRVCWQLCSGHAVLDLGVGNRSVFLSEVQSKLTLVAKVQVAFLTMIGLFSCVNAQVTLQRLQVTEARSADLTRVWLLPGVDQHMGPEMGNLHESSSTRLTSVWLFS